VVRAPSGDARNAGDGWSPFRGLREIAVTASDALGCLSPKDAVWVLLAIALSAAFRTGWLLVPSAAAYAVGVSLTRSPRLGSARHPRLSAPAAWGLGILPLALAPAAAAALRTGHGRRSAVGDPLLWTVAAAAVLLAVGALVGRFRRETGAASAGEDRMRFFAAAQRHPWLATALVSVVAAVDAVWGAFAHGAREELAHALVPVGGAAASVHLVARSVHPLGRLAPLVLAAPVATFACALLLDTGRASVDLTVLGPAAVLVAWTIGNSYALVRRASPSRTTLALARVWIPLVLVPEMLLAARIGEPTVGLVVLPIATPFLFSAIAELADRPRRAVVAGAGLAAAAGLLAYVVALPWMQRSGRTVDPIFGLRFDPRWWSGRDAVEMTELMVRQAEIGALCVVAGLMLRGARSLTALPRDHPVFTEGPWVPLPWRDETVSAAEPA